MANKSDSKLKTLKILEILFDETDEEHHLSYEKIAERLSQKGIEAERKSIKRDIEMFIEDMGMDIEPSNNSNKGAFVSGRIFELAELKLLADAVAASKFIPEEKANDLIGKLGKLTSNYQAKELKRQVVVTHRVKDEVHNIIYTLDTIYRCIDSNHAMEFMYRDWTIDKKMEYRHDGAKYIVSPAFLIRDNENYYLVAYSHKDEEIRFYRVDKIAKATELEQLREGVREREEIAKHDLSKNVFGMFAGKKETVVITCPNYRISNVFDRFGTDISVRKEDENRARVRIPVEISDQFFGWVSGLGADFVIEGPSNVKDEYKKFLEKLQKNYE